MTRFEEEQKELSNIIREFASAWLISRFRPKPSTAILSRWDKLISSWIRDQSMPLFIRKAREGRGKRIRHKSGRILIPADNSTAHWSFTLALNGRCPRKSRIKQMIFDRNIPVAFAPLPKERIHFKRNPYELRRKEYNLNLSGWKLAHIEPIGLKTRHSLKDRDIQELENHFKLFLDPSNMFVVPMKWAGIAEAGEIIEAFRANRKRRKRAHNIV